MLGVPLKNIGREITAVINTYHTVTNGLVDNPTSFWREVQETAMEALSIAGLFIPSKTDRLYEAIVEGDTAYRERLESGYQSESALETAIKKGLRENDPRIKEAAQAQIDGDLGRGWELFLEISNEGKFDNNTIIEAIQTEYNKLKPDDSEESADKAKSLYDTDEFVTAVMQGETALAEEVKADIIKTAQINGKTESEAEKSFKGSVSSSCKELFETGEMSQTQAVKILTVYGGCTADEATEKVAYWNFQATYPEYENLSESAVTKYSDYAKPANISLDVYNTYYTQTKGLTKKKDILEVIDGLNLTGKQKDALYYAEGYAESTIGEAPWR